MCEQKLVGRKLDQEEPGRKDVRKEGNVCVSVNSPILREGNNKCILKHLELYCIVLRVNLKTKKSVT